MTALLSIIAATFIVSLISFVGVLTLSFQEKTLKKILMFFVSFAAGAMLAATFFDILPESIEIGASVTAVFACVLTGLIVFFVIEKSIWHHYHFEKKCIHPVTYLNLIGDGVHNFIDGAIIAAAFLTSVQIGYIVTLSVIFHEVPQELGDFSVLIYGGMKKRRALWFNFISALTAMAGGLIIFFLSSAVNIINFMLPFAAGGLIYIAVADLFPELHKERKVRNSAIQFICLIFGVVLIWCLTKLLA